MALSLQECNNALLKIRSRYDKLIKEFKKSSIIKENFEQRYLNALRNHQNIDMFLFGEIEAVEELIKREEEKIKTLKENASNKVKVGTNNDDNKSSATLMMEENLKRLRKYPAIDIEADGAIEDVVRLLGAIRLLINDYYPALNAIYRDYKHLSGADKISNFYDSLLSFFDYKGEVPIARRYVDLLKSHISNSQQLEFEYRHILQETAFLLNDIYDCLEKIIQEKNVPSPTQKLVITPSKFLIVSAGYKEKFNNQSYSDAFQIVADFVEQILLDFRIRGIKRQK